MNLNNRVQLIGKAGSIPVIKTFRSSKLARFSVSTTDAVKRFDRIEKEINWHQIVVWDKLADEAEKNVFEGTQVVVDGRLVRRSYADKNGNKLYITEIVAETLLFNNSLTEKAAGERKIA